MFVDDDGFETGELRLVIYSLYFNNHLLSFLSSCKPADLQDKDSSLTFPGICASCNRT